MKSWVAPALRMVTFGFINPRKIVGVEVQRALVQANWIVIGGMWRLSLRTGLPVVRVYYRAALRRSVNI